MGHLLYNIMGSFNMINKITYHLSSSKVLVPEWLSGMTRNHVGFARAGSNPAEHVISCFKFLSVFKFFLVCLVATNSRSVSISLANHDG